MPDPPARYLTVYLLALYENPQNNFTVEVLEAVEAVWFVTLQSPVFGAVTNGRAPLYCVNTLLHLVRIRYS